MLAAMVVAVTVMGGCSASRGGVAVEQEPDCMERMAEKVRAAETREYLETLDGQRVRLAEFFDKCAAGWPHCVLFSKFYHWPSKVITAQSRGMDGEVAHKVRAYSNPFSICFPDDPPVSKAIYGDVGEIYDAGGAFMGLAVHMGKGRYFTIPYSGNRKLMTGPLIRARMP